MIHAQGTLAPFQLARASRNLMVMAPPGSVIEEGPPTEVVDLRDPLQAAETVDEKTPRPLSKVDLAVLGAITAMGIGGAILSAPSSQVVAQEMSQNNLHEAADAGVVTHHADERTDSDRSTDKVNFFYHIDASSDDLGHLFVKEVSQVESFKSISGGNVTAQVALVRHPDLVNKLGKAVLLTSLLAAPSYAGWKLLNKGTSKSMKMGVGLLGVAFLAATLGGAGREIATAIDTTNYALNLDEGPWNGYRFFEVEPDSSRGIDSKILEEHPDQTSPDVDRVGAFLGESMADHSDALNVVVFGGHGLGYRAAAGYNYSDFQKVLTQATQQSGRPIDLLVLESCVDGNLELLAGIAPQVRYAVVSEDNIGLYADLRVAQTSDISTSFGEALAKLQGGETSAADLGTRFLEQAQKYPSTLPTLVLVDMSKVPQLNSAVDRLGRLLKEEVEAGRTDSMQRAVGETPAFPSEEGRGSGLGFGDLKIFASRIEQLYGHAPRIQAAAREAGAALDEAVVARNVAMQHTGTGGISLQLPTKDFDTWESAAASRPQISGFDESGASQGWQDFVRAMSDVLARQ